MAAALLQNLLQNAIKHNQQDGEIQVSLSRQAFQVTNTGLAIVGDPMRFFERFRKHKAASDSPRLGLSIVQCICAYYGFRVRYEYTVGSARHTLQVEFE